MLFALNECRRRELHGQNFAERHALLKTRIPLKSFDVTTLPRIETQSSGFKAVVFERALSLKREWNQRFWKEKSEVLKNPEDRSNFQVVVISPRDPKEREASKDRDPSKEYFTTPDFTDSLYEKLSKDRLGPNSPARYIRGKHYKETDIDREGQIENKKNVNTVFIVASPIDGVDLDEIIEVAQEYRQNGTREVILIAPNMLDEREDKNVGKDDSGKINYNGRLIKIDSVMAKLSGIVDRIATYESHSSRTKASAALHNIALVNPSLEEELVNMLEINNPEEWAWVRPDEGRNLVATRAEKTRGIKGVHLSQIRDSKSLHKKIESPELTSQEKEDLKGKNVIIYDDEAGTFNTLNNVVDHILPAELKSINMLFGHARLQNGWEQNLEEIIKKCKDKGVKLRIVTTDSRVPVGDLKKFIENHPGLIEISSVNDKNIRIIEAIVDDVDLYSANNYKGSDFEKLMLDFIPGFDSEKDLGED